MTPQTPESKIHVLLASLNEEIVRQNRLYIQAQQEADTLRQQLTQQTARADALDDAVMAYAGMVCDMTQGDAEFPVDYADELAEIEDALARAKEVGE